MSQQPELILYFGSTPASERVKHMAAAYNKEVRRNAIDIVNIKMIRSRPTWLRGAPTLVTNSPQPKVWQGQRNVTQVIHTMLGELHHPRPEPPQQLQRDEPNAVTIDTTDNNIAPEYGTEGNVDLVATTSGLDTFIQV